MVLSRALQELAGGVQVVLLVVLVEVETCEGRGGHAGRQARGASTIEVGVHGNSSVVENVTSGEGSGGEGLSAVEGSSVGDDLSVSVGLELGGEEGASRTAGTVSENGDVLEVVLDGGEGGTGVANALRGEEGLVGVVGGDASAGASDGSVEVGGDGLLGLAIQVRLVRGEERVQVGVSADSQGSLGGLVIVDSVGGASRLADSGLERLPLGDEESKDQVGQADDTSSVVGNVGNDVLTIVGLGVLEKGVQDVESLGDIRGSERQELVDPDGGVGSVVVLHVVSIVSTRGGDQLQAGGVEGGGEVASGDVELGQVVELLSESGVDGSQIVDGDSLAVDAGAGREARDTLSGFLVLLEHLSGECLDGVLEHLLLLLVDINSANENHGVNFEVLGSESTSLVAAQESTGGINAGVAETSVGDSDGGSIGHNVGRSEVKVGVGDGEHREDGLCPATTESGVETNSLILVGRDEVAGNSVDVLGDGLPVDRGNYLIDIGGGVEVEDRGPDLVGGVSEGSSAERELELSADDGGLNVEGAQEEALVTSGGAVQGVRVEQGVHQVHDVSLESVVVRVSSRANLAANRSEASTEINLDVVGGTRVDGEVGERVQISERVESIQSRDCLALLEGYLREAVLQPVVRHIQHHSRDHDVAVQSSDPFFGNFPIEIVSNW